MDESEDNNPTENTGTDGRSDDKPGSSKPRRTKNKRVQNTNSPKQPQRPQQPPKPKVILDDWQQEALNHDGNLLLCTGRQVGKTFIMSRKASEYMVNHPNSRIICCSLTEDQAQLIIVMTLDYLEHNYKIYICKGNKKPTKNKIELTNGSQILARPVGNTGDAVRGFTGDVLILDECSRFAEFIFLASKPTLLTTGGQIWMCSTPFGKKGYFYECYQNRANRFKVIEANSWDVVHNRPISEVWTQQKRDEAIRFLEDEKNDMSEMHFAQEYLGKFVEDLRQFFSDEIIERVCCLKRRTTPILRDKQYWLGCDFARLGEDQSSFEILDKLSSNQIEQIENITTKKTLTTATFDRILNLNELYNFKQIGVDAGSGSLGVGILDFLLRSPVKRKVVALNNLARDMDKDGEKKKSLLKEDMYINMLAMLEKGTLKLLDDDEVKTSLRSVQYEYTTEENYSSKVRIFGNFTHVVEGLIRAAWLANSKSLNSFIDYI